MPDQGSAVTNVARAVGTFIRQAGEVERRYGISRSWQLLEAVRLKRRNRQFSLQDFFDFRLFERTPEAERRRATLAGRRMQSFLEYELNDQRWKCLVDDKIVSYLLMKAAAVPTPELSAVFVPSGRSVAGVRSCATPEQIAGFFRDGAPFPLFGKPIRGSVGKGGAAITGLDAGRDELLFANGTRLALREYAAGLADTSVSKHAAAGYLFQSLVTQHPDLVATAGPTVSTARIAALVGDESVQIHAAVWRIARIGNMTDNFDKGRAGNLLGAIDCSTGTVRRVIGGYGLTEEVMQTHPDTGATLVGLRIPDWQRAVDMVTRGAAAYPNLRFQHWDVAFSDAGPMALEVNAMGSTGILQYASGTGLMTPQLVAFLQRYGATSVRSKR
jgi:hypothetical protein